MAGVIEVRKLAHGDSTTDAESLLIRFFSEEAFETPHEVIREHCRVMVGLEACGLFIAMAKGQPAGIASVSMQYGIEFGWLGEIGDLYVVPEWRGQGIARKLIAVAGLFLKEHGASGYQVTVTPHAQHTHQLKDFYLKLGFSTEGREILYRHLV